MVQLSNTGCNCSCIACLLMRIAAAETLAKAGQPYTYLQHLSHRLPAGTRLEAVFHRNALGWAGSNNRRMVHTSTCMEQASTCR